MTTWMCLGVAMLVAGWLVAGLVVFAVLVDGSRREAAWERARDARDAGEE